ncbi:MAG: hypothetical protein OEQ18_05170 [Gammaproteobacteria bacterium]|nr:hypothetical protein [Gammaproteobacteria bacterium]
MSLKLVVPIAGVAAWSVAAFLVPQSMPSHRLPPQQEPAVVQHQELDVARLEQPATKQPGSILPIAAAQAAPVPETVAAPQALKFAQPKPQVTEQPKPTLPMAAAQAAPAPDATAAPAAVAIDAPQPSPNRNHGLAQELRAADQAMQPGGFGDACFDQIRAFFCPIVGQIPIARDMLGQVALIGGFSCPTGTAPDRS